MPRPMLLALHAAASSIALLTISVFWLSALAAELVFDHAGVAVVRSGILFALPLLVVALAVAGGSGAKLAGRSSAPIITAKRNRMKAAAANGLLILVPSAIFLAWKADAGAFDAVFAAVQIVELAAGAINIALLGLNMQAGLAMRDRRQRVGARGTVA